MVNNGLDYKVQLDTIQSGFTFPHCWVHPRAAAIPGNPPSVILMMQTYLLTGSDIFGPLNEMRTDDVGKTWSGPIEHADTLGLRVQEDGTRICACGFYPLWHEKSGKLIGIGHSIRYQGDIIKWTEPTIDIVYSYYDARARMWAPWEVMPLPDSAKYKRAGAGCTQSIVEPNGDILLPINFSDGVERYTFTVLRCTFDGKTLKYIENGSEHKLDKDRGYCEPSITKYNGKYIVTLRADEYGYVTSSQDGMHFDEPTLWKWEDGTVVPTYNTQHKWVTHSSGLFLVYTRKTETNGHVFRYRAPLFIAQVDSERLCLIRETERILVPERGARLGNFQTVNVTEDETWVTVAEKMLPKGCEKYGSNGDVFVVRLKWNSPNLLLGVI